MKYALMEGSRGYWINNASHAGDPNHHSISNVSILKSVRLGNACPFDLFVVEKTKQELRASVDTLWQTPSRPLVRSGSTCPLADPWTTKRPNSHENTVSNALLLCAPNSTYHVVVISQSRPVVSSQMMCPKRKTALNFSSQDHSPQPCLRDACALPRSSP